MFILRFVLGLIPAVNRGGAYWYFGSKVGKCSHEGRWPSCGRQAIVGYQEHSEACPLGESWCVRCFAATVPGRIAGLAYMGRCSLSTRLFRLSRWVNPKAGEPALGSSLADFVGQDNPWLVPAQDPTRP